MTPTALRGCGEGDLPDVRRDLWGYGVRIVLIIIVAGAGAPFQRHSECVLQTLTPRALSPAPRFASSWRRPFMRPSELAIRAAALVTHDTDFSRMRSLVIFA